MYEKSLTKKRQNIREFETVYVVLPFPNLSHIETISLPWWRVLADDAVVVINTHYSEMRTAWALLDAWDLRYVACVPMHRTHGKYKDPAIIAVRGDADLIYDLSQETLENEKSIVQAMQKWGSPRLVINKSRASHDDLFNADNNWTITYPTGSWVIDPFYYPLRKNGIDIDESLSDLLSSIRQEYRNSNFSMWKMVEMFAIMLVNNRTSKQKLMELVASATNGKIPPTTLRWWDILVQKIHAGDITVDYSKSVSEVINEIRRKQENDELLE